MTKHIQGLLYYIILYSGLVFKVEAAVFQKNIQYSTMLSEVPHSYWHWPLLQLMTQQPFKMFWYTLHTHHTSSSMTWKHLVMIIFIMLWFDIRASCDVWRDQTTHQRCTLLCKSLCNVISGHTMQHHARCPSSPHCTITWYHLIVVPSFQGCMWPPTSHTSCTNSFCMRQNFLSFLLSFYSPDVSSCM